MMSLGLNYSGLEELLRPYNPWWGSEGSWPEPLPPYERPVVQEILADLRELPQMVSVTGPRRVGKSTAVKQVILRLIRDQKVSAERIVYFSFDDPAVFASEELQQGIFDLLVHRIRAQGQVSYMFLDEVQRLPRWELFLKKYYDLKAPIRFVVSGSASSPIFRSSQESLLGRIKDRHLLPFSFREFCQYKLREKPEFQQALECHCGMREAMLNADGEKAARCANELHQALEPLRGDIDASVVAYCRDGGFPEVWSLPDPVRKIEYLMEQQVRKVLYEDLMMLTQYRKPENVLRFFVYLLAHPGIEINMSKAAQDAGVEHRVVEENLPRLEMTDLILRVQKFTYQPLRVRRGNLKTYPVDTALRNAVLKTWEPGSMSMGAYAENLVVRELMNWPEKIEVSYYREKDREVDFVVTFGATGHLPIEVKSGDPGKLRGLRQFMRRYDVPLGVVVTCDREAQFDKGIVYLPLRYFLLVNGSRQR